MLKLMLDKAMVLLAMTTEKHSNALVTWFKELPVIVKSLGMLGLVFLAGWGSNAAFGAVIEEPLRPIIIATDSAQATADTAIVQGERHRSRIINLESVSSSLVEDVKLNTDSLAVMIPIIRNIECLMLRQLEERTIDTCNPIFRRNR